MYDSRRDAVLRTRRNPTETMAIVNNALMSPEARNLLNHLLDLPPKFEINQRYVVNRGDYGGRDRVRRLFREMILAGHCEIDRECNPDGTFKRGIYRVSAEPQFLPLVDITDRIENAQEAPIAEGKTAHPAPDEPSLGIRNSIVNPDTDTARDNGERPRCTQLQADGRDRGRKAPATMQAERRTGGAKAGLPQNEPRQGAAKGSAVKGPARGEGDRTSGDRYTERLLDQMVTAASMPGSRMPTPRKAARSIASLIQWRAEGFDFELDILPAIADVCSRAADPDKPVVSWHYFTGAIRDWHARRTRPASRPSAPRRQLEGWTPAGAAYGRRQ